MKLIILLNICIKALLCCNKRKIFYFIAVISVPQKLVKSLQYSQKSEVQAITRNNGFPVFPSVARDFRYYFRLETRKKYETHENATVAVKWNAGIGSVKNTIPIYTEFLEMFHRYEYIQNVMLIQVPVPVIVLVWTHFLIITLICEFKISKFMYGSRWMYTSIIPDRQRKISTYQRAI